jgi:nitric-oxide synthase
MKRIFIQNEPWLTSNRHREDPQMSVGQDEITGESQRTALARQAEQFLALPEIPQVRPGRLAEVRAEIEATAYYAHTSEELLAGAKLAWRNHARCIGRMHWRSLKLLDFRHCATAGEVADACWQHLRYSTNGGALRSVISVFAPRSAKGAIRIWNPQLIRYAGYRQGDGRVIGDPLQADLTETAGKLGWRGRGGPFDVLPLIIQMPAEPPRLFQVPDDVVLEVEITHPELPWFAELGLKWHANPAISDMSLEIGGLSYTAAPFSGWYVGSEIGARNFSDEYRYNMLPVVAERMGLDTSHDRTMWKDRALIELTRAVLHSYRQAGVHIVDHHTAARQFVEHVDREHQVGRAVPAQWSWVNPPLSSSATPTYHREFDFPDFELRPNFVSQGLPSGCPVAGH